MKKIITALLIICLAFGLASCGKKESEETPVKRKSAVSDYTFSESYKDSKGNTVSRLDITLPHLEGKKAPAGAQVFNAYFENYTLERAKDAEMNADSISDYLERNGFTGPRVTEITYDIYYESDTLISVILKSRTGTKVSEIQPSEQAMTFSLVSGEQLGVRDFAKFPGNENIIEEMLDGIYKAADKTYSPNGVPLSDEKHALLKDAFDENSLLVKDDAFVFIYSFEFLSSGSRTGTYYCEVPLAYVENFYMSPGSYEA
ncbi:MAG: hypothetical protein IJM02_04015 [Clostridia bacterium]|nr:hypothetical protein [Clostridia bacterium]